LKVSLLLPILGKRKNIQKIVSYRSVKMIDCSASALSVDTTPATGRSSFNHLNVRACCKVREVSRFSSDRSASHRVEHRQLLRKEKLDLAAKIMKEKEEEEHRRLEKLEALRKTVSPGGC